MRAEIAATPDASDYTSIQARIADVNGSADAEVPSGEQATASPAPCAALEGETLRPEDEAQALPKVPLMPFDATARTPWAVPSRSRTIWSWWIGPAGRCARTSAATSRAGTPSLLDRLPSWAQSGGLVFCAEHKTPSSNSRSLSHRSDILFAQPSRFQ